jgi:hypothetical protein
VTYAPRYWFALDGYQCGIPPLRQPPSLDVFIGAIATIRRNHIVYALDRIYFGIIECPGKLPCAYNTSERIA